IYATCLDGHLAAKKTRLFFFQAEDGIRDKLVTGVQTCALPIFAPAGGAELESRTSAAQSYSSRRAPLAGRCDRHAHHGFADEHRSEERRVGKECRSRRWQFDLNEKNIKVVE